jgi:hypothetical protein
VTKHAEDAYKEIAYKGDTSDAISRGNSDYRRKCGNVGLMLITDASYRKCNGNTGYIADGGEGSSAPEPASLLLLDLCLVGVTGASRKFRK